jgi:hypothetical protein
MNRVDLVGSRGSAGRHGLHHQSPRMQPDSDFFVVLVLFPTVRCFRLLSKSPLAKAQFFRRIG